MWEDSLTSSISARDMHAKASVDAVKIYPSNTFQIVKIATEQYLEQGGRELAEEEKAKVAGCLEFRKLAWATLI